MAKARTKTPPPIPDGLEITMHAFIKTADGANIEGEHEYVKTRLIEVMQESGQVTLQNLDVEFTTHPA